MKKFKHGFIGLGKMAEILLRAFLKNGLIPPDEVLISRRNSIERKRLAKSLKIATTDSNLELIQNCDWIWLGIKPFQAQEVLAEIQRHFRPGQIVISMMAGISTEFLQKFLPAKTALVRLMPNTPALLGVGATGIYFSKNVSVKAQAQIRKMLAAIGKTETVSSENELDAVTGLSGSGPAFVYKMAEGLIQGGIESGLKVEVARSLAIQTLLGAAKMLEQGKSPEELIAQVVSKGGTTEAGLKVLERKKIAPHITSAVVRASQKAREIRKNFSMKK